MVVLPFCFFLSGKFANHQLVFNSANSNSISWAMFLGLNIACDRFGAPIRAVTDFSSVHFWEKMILWTTGLPSQPCLFSFGLTSPMSTEIYIYLWGLKLCFRLVFFLIFFLWGSVLFFNSKLDWIELWPKAFLQDKSKDTQSLRSRNKYIHVCWPFPSKSWWSSMCNITFTHSSSYFCQCIDWIGAILFSSRIYSIHLQVRRINV